MRYVSHGHCVHAIGPILATLVAVALCHGQEKIVVDFEGGNLDQWVVVDEPRENLDVPGPAEWLIVPSDMGLDGNALTQYSVIAGPPGGTPTMGTIIYYGEQKFTNFQLDVDVGTTDDDGIGLVWGYNDLDKHYRVMMINQTPMLTADKRISNARPWYERLGIVRPRDGYIPYPQALDRPFHWTLEVLNGSFTFTSTDSKSGDQVTISGNDDTYRSGYVGLQTSAQQVIEFDNFTITPLVEAPLQAGDADQDLDFDQLDLVRVQIAARYLSGQPATWGQGDWNGAPGGSRGNPPAGDRLFNQRDIVAALQAAKYLAGPYAALAPAGSGDAKASIQYDPTSGELGVRVGQTELTSINIDSAAGILTGQTANHLGGSFDNHSANNIFKATFGSSFGSLSFGNVAQPGLTEAFLVSDLTVVGSLAGGGDLGVVDLVMVPEPEALALLWLGLASLIGFALRRPRLLAS
jgi:hypothetical protein